MSLEGWKAFFEIGGVVLLLLTFAFGAGALIVNNRLNAIQAKELGDFRLKFEEEQQKTAFAQKEAAEAKQIAGGFEIAISTANQRAAEANAKAEGFRLDIAKSNERAAEAVQKAEEERLARVRIEEKLAGWKLDAPAQARIIEKLKKYAKTPFDLGANPVEMAFMETMDGVLGSAGWTRQMPKPDNPLASILLNGKARINYVSGIYVEFAQSRYNDFSPAAGALVLALRAEGIPAQGQMSPNEPDTTAIHLVVGSK